MTTFERFLDDVQAIGGAELRPQVERIAVAALEVLGERLPQGDARAVARDLPASLGTVLTRGDYQGDFALDELYQRVQQRLASGPGYAMEQTQAVCQAIGGRLTSETRTRLRRHLDAELVALFEPRRTLSGSWRPIRPPATSASTLSGGRPGFSRPLYEAGPHDTAQHDSIAANENPHADTKISSARGISSVRDGQSLAEGHPSSGAEPEPER